MNNSIIIGNKPKSRKKTGNMSNAMTVFIACAIGIGITLGFLNYYHASSCADPDVMESYVDSLERRLKISEANVINNRIFMKSMFDTLQSRYLELDKEELELIAQYSQDEAVRISLLLETHPVLPMPYKYTSTTGESEFNYNYGGVSFSESELKDDWLNIEETNKEKNDKLADDDDFFIKNENNNNNNNNNNNLLENFHDDYKGLNNNILDDYEVESKDTTPKVILSDADAHKLCIEWKDKYLVIPGVSWGELSFELQGKWLENSCDYHLS
jgi:hypothetical protein